MAIISIPTLFKIISCRTLHSEQRHYLKHFKIITNKYGWHRINIKDISVHGNYKLPTREQTKSFLAFEEHTIVLWPDSMNATYPQIVEAAVIKKCDRGRENKKQRSKAYNRFLS